MLQRLGDHGGPNLAFCNFWEAIAAQISIFTVFGGPWRPKLLSFSNLLLCSPALLCFSALLLCSPSLCSPSLLKGSSWTHCGKPCCICICPGTSSKIHSKVRLGLTLGSHFAICICLGTSSILKPQKLVLDSLWEAILLFVSA